MNIQPNLTPSSQEYITKGHDAENFKSKDAEGVYNHDSAIDNAGKNNHNENLEDTGQEILHEKENPIVKFFKSVIGVFQGLFSSIKSLFGIDQSNKFLEDKTVAAFKASSVKDHGDGTCTTSYTLTPIQNDFFTKEVTVLTGVLLDRELGSQEEISIGAILTSKNIDASSKLKIPKGLCFQFLKDVARDGIFVGKTEFFSKSFKASQPSADQVRAECELLASEIVEMCNEDENAAEVLSRFANQQINSVTIDGFGALPLNGKHHAGYGMSGPAQKFYINKINGGAQVIAKMSWGETNGALFDPSKNHLDDASKIATEVNFSFELEFVPKKLKTNVSDYFEYMHLSKGLTIDVKKNQY